MKKGWIIAIVLIVGLFVLAYAGLIVWLVSGADLKGVKSGGAIALIRIEGSISASGLGDGLLGGTGVSPENVITQLKEAVDDNSVKAILLRVNSPGGTAAASQEIYEEVKRASRKKPVVVSVADIGASGAYWISCGADRIVANPASEVGSIGVIIMLPNYQELYKKIGIDYVVITQGKYKDLGNPNRKLTDEEKTLLEEQSKVIYDQFIEAVAEGRKLSKTEVKEMATGFVFLGSEAKKMGLIDKIGNYQDAIKLAAEMGEIEGEPEIIEYTKPTLGDVLSQLFEGKKVDLLNLLLLKSLGGSQSIIPDRGVIIK